MKEERIMSFQVSKKLDEVSVEKVNGGSAPAFNFPNMTYSNDSNGIHIKFDNWKWGIQWKMNEFYHTKQQVS